MPAPVESGGFGSVGDIPQRHPHSPPSTKEVRMLTEMGTTRGVHDSPIRDRDLDDSDAWSDDSHHTVPFTPDRGAPPSYEETMSSPMPTGPPRSPPRLGNHQSSYSGEVRGHNFCGCSLSSRRVTSFFPTAHARLVSRTQLNSHLPPNLTPHRISPTPTQTTGGAEYDSLGFPVPDWLSPRYVNRASWRLLISSCFPAVCLVRETSSGVKTQ